MPVRSELRAIREHLVALQARALSLSTEFNELRDSATSVPDDSARLPLEDRDSVMILQQQHALGMPHRPPPSAAQLAKRNETVELLVQERAAVMREVAACYSELEQLDSEEARLFMLVAELRTEWRREQEAAQAELAKLRARVEEVNSLRRREKRKTTTQ